MIYAFPKYFLQKILEESDVFLRENDYIGLQKFFKTIFDLNDDIKLEDKKDKDQIKIDTCLLLAQNRPEFTAKVTPLLLRYYHQYESNGSAPENLKKWVLNRLYDIVNGSTPNEAFGYKTKRGQRKTSRLSYDPIKIVAYYHLNKRSGKKEMRCVDACTEKFGTTPPTLFKYRDEIGEFFSQLSDQALKFYTETDLFDFLTTPLKSNQTRL